MRHLLTLLLAWSILSTGVSAQSIGLHPPEVDWQKLTTPEGNILYPSGYEARAQRIANLMHLMRTEHDTTVGDRHYRFDMVLQTPNNTVNGFVAFAPFRSELFLTPPQQLNLLSSGDWADILTIHEFRHVQQRSNHRRGLTKLFSYVAGQLAWAGSANFTVPNWYTEGDATMAETMFTPAGRGRTPAFSATLRALELAGKRYNYARARNNSFRRLIPDHYRYGYNTITYGREQYGFHVWTDVHQQAAAYRGLFYPFSRNLKRATGRGTKQLYGEALDDLRRRQEESLDARGPFTEGESVNVVRSAVTDYLYPAVTDRGALVAYRRGYQHTPALVLIDPSTGKEQRLVSIGWQREPYADVRGSMATWMERYNDPRYVNEGYSNVIVYDLTTGKRRRLGKTQRYFSPALSFDNKRIVTVEDDVMNGRLNLVILSVEDGRVLQTFPVDAVSAGLPKFSPGGDTVYYYERDLDGNALVALDLSSGRRTTLKKASFEQLGNLQVAADGSLIYSSGRDGIDNAYHLAPQSGLATQLTNVRIGAEYPFLSDDGQLYYTEATPLGMRLRVLYASGGQNGSGISGLPQGMLPAAPNVMQRPKALAPEAVILSADVPTERFPSEDVNDNLYGLRLHSWNAVGTAVAPGIGLAASNALNTVELNASARYNINERRSSLAASASYGGWYPVLTASVAAFDRSFNRFTDTDTTVIVRSSSFNQITVAGTVSTPWRWTAGQYSFGLSPSLSIGQTVVPNDSERGGLPAGFVTGRARVRFSAFQQRARSQVQSKWGIAGLLDYQNTPFDAGLGSAFRAEGRLNLPGLFNTHSFRVSLGYQSENTRNPYQFVDLFQYVRGYDINFAGDSYRVGLDYEFPLAYPEIGLWGIYYLSRVRLDAFYDFGRYRTSRLPDQPLSAVGVELFLDQTLLNTVEVSFGFRASLRLQDHLFEDAAGTVDFQGFISQSF